MGGWGVTFDPISHEEKALNLHLCTCSVNLQANNSGVNGDVKGSQQLTSNWTNWAFWSSFLSCFMCHKFHFVISTSGTKPFSKVSFKIIQWIDYKLSTNEGLHSQVL